MSNRIRQIMAAALAIASLTSCAPRNTIKDAELRFRDAFQNMPVDKVAESEIPGVYEVYSQGKLFYFAPAQEVVLFGEFYTTAGESVTQRKIAEYMQTRSMSVPTDVGVTIGDGPAELIGFLDPDCGHCQQAHDWLEKRDYAGLRLRVVFLQMSPDNPSYARATQFVCAPPELRREALRQLYAHENPAPGQHFLTCDGAAEKLKAQADLARDLGVNGTPTFLLKGQTVLGFNQERLESLLSSTN